MAKSMKKPLHIGAILALAATIAGCSALQIDVDVYKGPLASQREVQLRQFSTLAIAAKPLLAELRNDAERRTQADKEAFDKMIGGRYLEQHVAYNFKDPLAKFANGVLSFYEDLGPNTFLPQADATQDEYLRFSDAIDRFEVALEDCEMATQLEKSSVPESARNLRARYVRFLRAGSLTDEKSVSSKCAASQGSVAAVFTSSAALGKRRIEDVQQAWEAYCGGRLGSACISMHRSVSAAYQELSGSKLAVQHANALYPDDPVSAGRLARRVQAIGRSFGDARHSMKSLASLSLSLLRDTEIYAGAEPDQETQQKHLVAELVANVIEPRVLVCAAQMLDDGAVDPNFRAQVIQLITIDWSSQDNRGDMYQQANRVVREIIEANPKAAAASLTALHARLLLEQPGDQSVLARCDPYNNRDDAAAGAETLVRSRMAELKYATERFGLARGTAVDNLLDATLLSAVSDIRIVGGNSFGFESGRTRWGIITLTRNYQNAVNRSPDEPGAKKAVEESRRLLEEQLITFAERVLYVANNYDMIERKPTKAAVTYGEKNGFDATSGSSSYNNDDVYFAERAAILQAVGNNIIVLIDDIRRQGEHDKALVSRRDAEATAINRAFSGNSSQTFDALLQEIKASLAKDLREGSRLGTAVTAAGNSKTALDREIENLEAAVIKKQKTATDTAASAEAIINGNKQVRYAALTLLANTDSAPTLAVVDDASAIADRAKIAGDIAKIVGAKSSGETYRTAAQKWLDDEIVKEAADTPRFTRLTAAKSYLEANALSFKVIADGATNLTLSAFRNVVAAHQKAAEAHAKLAKQSADAAESNLAADKKILQARIATRTAAADALQAAEGSVVRNNAAVAEINAVLSSVKDVRGEVLNKADESGSDAKSLMSSLISVLNARADKFAKEQPEAPNNFKVAAGYVGKFTPSLALTVMASRGGRSGRGFAAGERTQVDVLDDLIAHLRQQRISALAAGLAERASSLNSALEAAYEQRAGMAYLRPTSAYLRNVYAATSVQSDPDVGWVNLLWRNASRSARAENQELKARVNVEKQFWQNINTVQLSGAGAANYVVVKDDVGNWYIKAYAGDTSSIIQSAQGLALFNLGKKFDINLLKRAEMDRQLLSSDITSERRTELQNQINKETVERQTTSGASTSGLANVQKRYAEAYAKQTASDLDSLSTSLVNINQTIEAAWMEKLGEPGKTDAISKLKTFTSTTSTEVTAGQTRLSEASAAKPEDLPAASADAIIDSLRGVKRLKARLKTAILQKTDLTDGYSSDLATKTQARIDANKALDDEKKGAADPATVADLTNKLDKANKDENDAKNLLASGAANRTKAADAVVVLLDQLVIDVSSKRVDAVNKLTTAYGFIGEAATSK